MNILHTADWHLGNTFHGHHRSAEHAHFLAWLLDVVRQRRPDALLLSGDIFDSPNPPASAERQLYDFLTAATTAVDSLQVVITAGNHDSGGRLEAPAELLRRSNIYVRGVVRRDADGEIDFDHYILPLSTSGDSEARLCCLALPYLRTADYPAGLTPTEGLCWFLDQLMRRHRKSDFKGLPVIVAAHFYAAGADICDNEHSERLVVGGQECINAGEVRLNAAYVALGHIHKAQRVGAAKMPMYYSGSALPLSFSEKHYQHGVYWVEDVDGDTPDITFVPYTPQRALLSVPERGAVDADDLLEALRRLPQRDKGDDGTRWPYLEIRVTERRPHPSLMRDVTEALADRAVHFCRMVREVPNEQPAEALAGPDILHTLSPHEMAQRIFERRYNAPMPKEMTGRFAQAVAALEENDAADADDSDTPE
jgi:exonuclease SbcD